MNTIAAISTPYGVGGIAVIRVSGEQAIGIVDSLFSGKKPLKEARTASVHYGMIRDLDEVLVSVFRAPHSFTGEDVVEIAAHGSLYIQQEMLRLLTEAGCRMAGPGEFTRRAFLNGRMDLTRAEAVADLIAAQTKAEKDLALSQLRGGISAELSSLREQLLHFTSLLELELDFADHEDIAFVDRSELKRLSQEIEDTLKQLCESFRAGNAIRDGIMVAIVGATNAGKSTLLNTILHEERAIVSDIHGTTRDTIEDTFILDGIKLRLIDTAGIRETEDAIEALGIERSKRALAKAHIVIEVVDATDPILMQDWSAGEHQHHIRVFNKADIQTPTNGIAISAQKGEIEPLLSALREAVKEITGSYTGDSVCISNVRHYDALSRALVAIQQVESGLEEQISGEFLSMDLQDCLEAIGEVTGQITNDEVLGNIFSHFCIGK